MERADKFFKAARVDDLADGEGRVVQAGLKKIALFRLGDEYHAIQWLRKPSRSLAERTLSQAIHTNR